MNTHRVADAVAAEAFLQVAGVDAQLFDRDQGVARADARAHRGAVVIGGGHH